jgi:hypothetical protein
MTHNVNPISSNIFAQMTCSKYRIMELLTYFVQIWERWWALVKAVQNLQVL